MTARPMVPGRTGSARRTGCWLVESPPVHAVADNREGVRTVDTWAQCDLETAMVDLPSGTVTFSSPTS